MYTNSTQPLLERIFCNILLHSGIERWIEYYMAKTLINLENNCLLLSVILNIFTMWNILLNVTSYNIDNRKCFVVNIV